MSALRFRNLHLLQLIVRHGSVRKAAEALSVTQPAASAMLQEVEQLLGLQLFERSRSGMLPTEALESLLQRLTVIENEVKALEHDSKALRTRDRQTYRLGALPRSMQDVMPRALAATMAENPDADFSLTEATSDVLLQGLADNRYDCVLARITRDTVQPKHGPAPFDFVPLYEEGMCVVAGKRHVLAGRKRLTLRDTTDWGWVLPPLGSVTRNLLIDEFLRLGLLPPVPVIESTNFISNLGLAEQAGLLTAAPVSAAHKYAELQGVQILDLKLSMPLPPISLIWRAGRPLQGALETLRDELIRCCGL